MKFVLLCWIPGNCTVAYTVNIYNFVHFTSEIYTQLDSADPDQTSHMSSLIRIFTVCDFNKLFRT